MNKDYRIFVGAFPREELADCIQALRQHYDPRTAAITAPHVTLAGTYWRSGQPTSENEAGTIARLRATAARIEPFDLVLGGIRAFLPKSRPVIYLGVEKNPALLAARRALVEALGQDRQRHFSPHMTLAMRLKGAAAQVMLDELRGGEWDSQRWTATITELRLMARGSDDPTWHSIARLVLST